MASIVVIMGSVFVMVYVISRNAMLADIRERAVGVKEYILENIFAEDLIGIGQPTPEGIRAAQQIQDIYQRIHGIGNLARLYIATIDQNGNIITSMMALGYDYVPVGEAAADLRQSLREDVAVMGRRIYRSDYGNVYTIFWPARNQEGELLGAVSMEFCTENIFALHRDAAVYSLALSGALMLLVSVIAYLSISRATEPFYRKLAYTDLLTGHENRMAFEHRLRECAQMAQDGKRVTLMICDMNDLKIINDNYGHDAGDEYLKKTAEIIHEHINGKGSLYRIGGDEFACLMVETKPNDAERIMQALRTESRRAYKTYPFSCATGMAAYDKEKDASIRDLFKRADRDMYAHKQQQKNKEN